MSAIFKKILPTQVYDKLRSILVYRPNDPITLLQQAPQKMKQVPVERIQGYRYPAPGSIKTARIPTRESEDDIYDVKHYARDYRNAPRDTHTAINASAAPLLMSEQVLKVGSPGMKTPAVLLYDPSGLRSSMTATWSELDKSIALRATPDHLVRPSWWSERDSLDAMCEAKGIPPLFGKPYRPSMSANYNTERW